MEEAFGAEAMRVEAERINKSLDLLEGEVEEAMKRRSSGLGSDEIEDTKKEKNASMNMNENVNQVQALSSLHYKSKSRQQEINKLRIAPGMQNYRGLRAVVREFECNSKFQFKSPQLRDKLGTGEKLDADDSIRTQFTESLQVPVNNNNTNNDYDKKQCSVGTLSEESSNHDDEYNVYKESVINELTKTMIARVLEKLRQHVHN